ncbi:MAG TPA: DUF1428 family protein [Lichenihabitans sp.]|jgi:uncharacterized protein YbaA (DUF1428 family)|nr:DUF1428 family protein [Lichenihabitans sp.]
MSYIQGFVVPVKTSDKEAYRAFAAKVAPMFREYGATRVVEAWGVDVPDGKVTDFKRAVDAAADEAVVFAWIVWPDRATCDAAVQKMRTDERTKADGAVPFDMQRMIFGGFATIFDTRED